MLAKSGRWEGLAAHRKSEEGGGDGVKKINNKKIKIPSQGSFSTAEMSKDINIYCLQNTKLFK